MAGCRGSGQGRLFQGDPKKSQRPVTGVGPRPLNTHRVGISYLVPRITATRRRFFSIKRHRCRARAISPVTDRLIARELRGRQKKSRLQESALKMVLAFPGGPATRTREMIYCACSTAAPGGRMKPSLGCHSWRCESATARAACAPRMRYSACLEMPKAAAA